MSNQVRLESRSSWREIGSIVFMLWVWSVMVFSAGIVLGYNLH